MSGRVWPAAGLGSVGLLLAPAAALYPTHALLLLAGVAVVVVAAVRPVEALTGYVATTPLLVGVARGSLVPGLRLNEALLLPVGLGLAIAVLCRWRALGWRRPAGFAPLDAAVVAVAVTSSVTPLLWMYARDRAIAGDDVLYALALWKLAAVYALVRLLLRNPAAVRRALHALVGTALAVGAVGTLQAVGYRPVIDVLARWVPPEEGGYDLTINRAMATLGNPIAYGDLLVYAAVVAGALALRGSRARGPLWAGAGMLALAGLASGQVTTVLAVLVAGVAFGVATGMGRRVVAAGLGLLAIGAVVLQPVVAARLEAIDPSTGLPVSWTGRYGRVDNLVQYFWPEITSSANWLFGVRTSSRVPGAEDWREWVYIESGYVWALWNGGLPLLVSVLTLLVVALHAGRRLARSADRTAAAVGVVLCVLPWVMAVLMVLDPHLSLRGAADLFFVLLAVGATLDVAHRERALPGGDAGTPVPIGSGRDGAA